MPPLKAQLLLEESLSAYFPEMVFTDSGITVQLHRNTHLDRNTMEAALIRVCQGHFVSISALANIVERDAQSIRQQYLKALVEAGKLRLAFPQYKTHWRQGYIAVAERSTPSPQGSS